MNFRKAPPAETKPLTKKLLFSGLLFFLSVLFSCASSTSGENSVNPDNSTASSASPAVVESTHNYLKLAEGVSEEMLDVDWWLARCKNPDKVLMDTQMISLWNQQNYDSVLDSNSDFYVLTDLRKAGRTMTAEEIRKYIVYYNPSVPWFKKVETKKGTVIKTLGVSDFKIFWQEMNLSPLVSWKDWINQKWIPMHANKTEYKIRKGVCLRRSNLRLIPEDNFYSDDREYWYDDYAQNSGIAMNEPVLVLWTSADGKWFYVRTSFCWGWIHKDDIAYCTDREFDSLFDWTDRPEKDFITITADHFTLSEDYSIKVPGFKKRVIDLYMGTYLQLADLSDEKIYSGFGGRLPHASYIVKVPYKKDDGMAGWKYAAVPSGIACRGLLPYTQKNVLRLAFAPLGQRYGWGGMAGSRDCSEYLRDIFHCFGFNFARNSRSQLSMPGKTVSLEELKDQEKTAALDSLEAGTVMGFPGHVYLYLGKVGNEYYSISALGSYHPDGKTIETRTDANSVTINTLKAARKTGKTWLEVTTKAKLLVDDGNLTSRTIGLDPKWEYASFSKINSGQAVLYKAKASRKDITIAVNAGHGTSGGSKVKTYSHPDKSPKITGGTTAAGEVESIAVSGGMTFKNGASEAVINLKLARYIKDKLIKEGYDVLMIRDGDDVQLDNIARTVIANNNAQLHLSIHFDGDSGKTDKGSFYCSIPDGLKKLKTVKKHYARSQKFGQCFAEALTELKLPVYNNGRWDVDLTQTSYSTIPTADLEFGNQFTGTDEVTLQKRADAVLLAIKKYFL